MLFALLITAVFSQNPVSVSLYYESFCPGCQDLVLHQIYPATKSISSIMNVTLVPYGNAYTRGQDVQCQHGEKECEGNMWELCAISLYPDFDQHFRFIYCMEKAGSEMLNHVSLCANAAGVDKVKLQQCYDNDGLALLIAAGKRTPTHQYVPWVTVNGKHNSAAEDDLIQTVCDLYDGEKPAGCRRESVQQGTTCESSETLCEYGQGEFACCEPSEYCWKHTGCDVLNTCPDNQKECVYAEGKSECCLSGEYCIPNVGCRCANEGWLFDLSS